MSKDTKSIIDSLDSEAIAKEIEAAENELIEFAGKQQRKIDSLRALLRAADIAKNGSPLRKPRGPNKKKTDAGSAAVVKPGDRSVLRPVQVESRPTGRPSANRRAEVASDIKACLARHGALTPRQISDLTGHSVELVISTCNTFDDCFKKLPGNLYTVDEEK